MNGGGGGGGGGRYLDLIVLFLVCSWFLTTHNVLLSCSDIQTEEVNNVDLEQCPAYMPTKCQNRSRIDGVDLEQCPAYIPTTCQNQTAVTTDGEGEYDYYLT